MVGNVRLDITYCETQLSNSLRSYSLQAWSGPKIVEKLYSIALFLVRKFKTFRYNIWATVEVTRVSCMAILEGYSAPGGSRGVSP